MCQHHSGTGQSRLTLKVNLTQEAGHCSRIIVLSLEDADLAHRVVHPP